MPQDLIEARYVEDSCVQHALTVHLLVHVVLFDRGAELIIFRE